MFNADDTTTAAFARMARDIQDIKSQLTQVLNSIRDAESEIPEKMRRFIMYMHDVHDVMYMYEERGIPVPPYIMREVERCDDRYRHLLEELNAAGGTFDKVRRDMTQRSGNRWDHSKLLPKLEPTPESTNETRSSPNETIEPENRTEAQSDLFGSGGEHRPETGPHRPKARNG